MSRRRNPDTLHTGDLVAMGSIVTTLAAALTPLLGDVIATRIATGHPLRMSDPLGHLIGLWKGAPKSGLPVGAPVPSTTAIYGWTAAVAIIVVLLVAGGWFLLHWSAGGRRPGYARRREIGKVAGIGRVRDGRNEIRPDLKGKGVQPGQCGIRIGRAGGRELYTRADRTVGVFGPQGSGKTLDILAPALIAAPGAALVTLTKLNDLLLVIDERARGGRPVFVLDPYNMAPGLPALVWNPLEGCSDATVAARRANAFIAGTLDKSSGPSGSQDSAAVFYKAEVAKALAALFHAAALTGRTMEHVAQWVARADLADEAVQILRHHGNAEPYFDSQLVETLFAADERTSGNTRVTMQQAMAPFREAAFRARFTPSADRPATDIEDVLRRGGTIFLLGREDPYTPVTPLMTAVAEHVLDEARRLATASRFHRLVPWMIAVLDELPSVAPIPSLVTSMANDRALGICYLWASQTRQQLIAAYGETEAGALVGLTNNLLVFGGGKDERLYDDVAKLIGTTRVPGSRRRDFDYMPVLQPGDLRRLTSGRAVLLTETARPVLVKLDRCITGPDGPRLLRQQREAAARVDLARSALVTPAERDELAVAWARDNGLSPEDR